MGFALGLTPCQVGPGRVGVWVESGTGGGRIGVDSVSSRAGSGRGLGRVGDGWGRVGDGSDCNALLIGVTGVLHVDDMAGMRKLAHRLAVADDGSQWSTEILGVDEAYQVLEQCDAQTLKQEQKDMLEKKQAHASFHDQFKSKMIDFTALAVEGKGRGKGKGKKPVGLKGIYPLVMGQADAKHWIPEGASIWRGWGSKRWCGHMPPWRRIHTKDDDWGVYVAQIWVIMMLCYLVTYLCFLCYGVIDGVTMHCKCMAEFVSAEQEARMLRKQRMTRKRWRTGALPTSSVCEEVLAGIRCDKEVTGECITCDKKLCKIHTVRLFGISRCTRCWSQVLTGGIALAGRPDAWAQFAPDARD